MISGGSDASYKKQSVVNRRMFILSAAKLLVFGGIVTKLFSLQMHTYIMIFLIYICLNAPKKVQKL